MLEMRVNTNNPSIPMNMYRSSKSSSMDAVFPEIEKCLEAYYGLVDDCEGYPEWQQKVRKELGCIVS